MWCSPAGCVGWAKMGGDCRLWTVKGERCCGSTYARLACQAVGMFSAPYAHATDRSSDCRCRVGVPIGWLRRPPSWVPMPCGPWSLSACMLPEVFDASCCAL